MLIDLSDEELEILADHMLGSASKFNPMVMELHHKLYAAMKQPKDLESAIQQIAHSHREILNQFCRAYLSELYAEHGHVKIEDIVLNSQGTGAGWKYWFEKKEAKQ